MKQKTPRKRAAAKPPGKTQRSSAHGSDGAADVAAFLRQLPRAQRDLLLAARARIQQLVPSATEAVRAGWGLLGFSAPRYFAFLAPPPARAPSRGRKPPPSPELSPSAEELVRLGFEQGVLLEDPWGLLVGAGTQVRFIPLAQASDLARPGVDALVLQAAELARRSRGPAAGRRQR